MSGSDSTGDFQQVPGNETANNADDIPLVLVNDGAEGPERKRSRAISKVSMSSDDETQGESVKVF